MPIKRRETAGLFNLTPFTFELTRTGDLTGSSSVHWSLPGVSVGSTQPNGSTSADHLDFNTAALEGDVTFGPGENSKIITIDIKGDSNSEKDETFNVQLSSPTDASLGTVSAIGTILNDDFAFNITPTTMSKPEGNSGFVTYEFTVTREGDLSQIGSVDWVVNGHGSFPAAIGLDIQNGTNLSQGTLSFAVGEASKTIQVKVNGDTTLKMMKNSRLYFPTPWVVF